MNKVNVLRLAILLCFWGLSCSRSGDNKSIKNFTELGIKSLHNGAPLKTGPILLTKRFSNYYQGVTGSAGGYAAESYHIEFTAYKTNLTAQDIDSFRLYDNKGKFICGWKDADRVLDTRHAGNGNAYLASDMKRPPTYDFERTRV